MATSTKYCITEKAPIAVVAEKVVHDIVGCDVDGEYAICLGCDKPMQWIKSKYLKGCLDLDLLIKKQALDAGAMVTPAIICHDDNMNIVLYNEFCKLYMVDTRNNKSPLWDGCWFYQGRAMHVVDKLLCYAKMLDNKIYYLVEWGNQFKMKHSWIEHQELLFYIKETCTAWQQFDANWDVIANRKMSPNEKKHLDSERSTFWVAVVDEMILTGFCWVKITFQMNNESISSTQHDVENNVENTIATQGYGSKMIMRNQYFILQL